MDSRLRGNDGGGTPPLQRASRAQSTKLFVGAGPATVGADRCVCPPLAHPSAGAIAARRGARLVHKVVNLKLASSAETNPTPILYSQQVGGFVPSFEASLFCAAVRRRPGESTAARAETLSSPETLDFVPVPTRRPTVPPTGRALPTFRPSKVWFSILLSRLYTT